MLSLEKLENVRRTAGKITARCPACHEAGGDRTGNHLVYWPANERFACAARPGDKLHRQRIWQLSGVPADRPPVPPRRAAVVRLRANAATAGFRESLSAAARREAGRIFSHDWNLADIGEQSPILLDGSEPDWHALLVLLHPPEAMIWIGAPHESGPGHECHFQTWRAWMESYPQGPPRAMTCPDQFFPGVCSRSAANIAASPYLVVEADEAIGRKPVTAADRAENIRRNLCIHRWLKEDLRWPLHALVHTGGKSCHAWFQRPPEADIDDLKAIAPALGIDSSVFTPAHPVRLPGVAHEGTGGRSRLLYLAPR
ncbi:MAG TPA: hypothetical protein VG796_03180 [Verrucomicrobiales bacterium]|nr:hypothetical protein [Verrucomicrobiales bacterium]